MQAAALPAISGWHWVRDGWTLFRSQPLAFFSWAMFISLILMIASLTPPIGPVVFIVLMPSVTFMSLSACRLVSAGKKMTPAMWVQPLREKSILRKLLGMGALYMFLCLTFGLIAFAPFMSELSDAMQTAASTNNLIPLLDVVRTPMMVFGVMYVLMASLFWYAPALVGWWDTGMTQSLFFSGIACWRNKWAFAVYGLVWAGVFIGVDLAMSFLTLIGIPENVTATLQVPINIIAGGILYCSFYPSYVSVFEQAPDPTEHAEA